MPANITIICRPRSRDAANRWDLRSSGNNKHTDQITASLSTAIACEHRAGVTTRIDRLEPATKINAVSPLVGMNRRHCVDVRAVVSNYWLADMVVLPGLEIYTLPQPLSALCLPSIEGTVRAYNPSLAWHRETLIMAFRISSMTRCEQRFVDFERYYLGELPPIVNALGVAFLDPATMAVREERQLNVAMPKECSWTLGYEDPRIFSFCELVISARMPSKR